MSISFNVERDIALKMLSSLPAIAIESGQVIVRGNRGILSVVPKSDTVISYSYIPSSKSDIPISQTGYIRDETNRIADLAHYILGSRDGRISYSSDNSNFGGNLTGFPYPDVDRRQLVLGNISRFNMNTNAGGGVKGSGGFLDRYPNGYGDFDMSGIRTVQMDESQMFNMGRGYDLSGGESGNLLTSGTYDGGNEILTGGGNAYRSNYGSNRQPGTEYGENYIGNRMDLWDATTGSVNAMRGAGVPDTHNSNEFGYGDLTASISPL